MKTCGKPLRLVGNGGAIFRTVKRDESNYWARNSISSVSDDKGQMTHFICIQDDLTLELELTEQLKYQACHDGLTNLVNGREFERRAARLLSTIHQDHSEHALCLMELDQFKIVNDTCGRFAGDALLRQLSNILRGVVRHRDTLARFGGNEFAVLMEHCNLDQAHRVTETLQQAVRDYQFVCGG
jgi:diguanylate cyclase (GGDEF)-like protein